MPRLLALIFVLSSTLATRASGWNDYRIQIDPGFTIVRANRLDVVLCRVNGRVILSPQGYAGVGPINAYVVTPTHILTRHDGRAPRNLFVGDTIDNVDTTKRFFFVTLKADSTVCGPFDEQTFLSQPAVQAVAPISWVEPNNPNVARPHVGSLFAFMISTIFLDWPFVLLLLIAGVVFVLWRRRVRGQAAAG